MINLGSKIIHEDMEHIYSIRNDWHKMLHGQRVYITGATGMIASYLTAYLIFLNESKSVGVCILANARSEEKLRNRFGEYVDREYFQAIIGDVSESIRVESEPDYIIHAASLASPQYYGVRPVETMLPNIIGTNEVLKLARNSSSKGVLFFSSGSVYGEVTGAESVTEETFGTLRYLELGNSYGESKRCGEALCNAYYYEYGVSVKCARIHHTYGPNMDYQNDKRVFAEFVNNIVNGQNIVMKSDGSARRAFCYITDVIDAVFTIFFDGENGEIYNILNDQEYCTVRELAEQLVALYPEKGLKVDTKQRDTSDVYCGSRVKRLIPVSNKKLKGLGWKPCVTVKEGFKRTIDYIQGEANEAEN